MSYEMDEKQAKDHTENLELANAKLAKRIAELEMVRAKPETELLTESETMDKAKAALTYAKHKLEELGFEPDQDNFKSLKYHPHLAYVLTLANCQHVEEAEDLGDKLEFALDIINYAAIWAAQIMHQIDKKEGTKPYLGLLNK